MSDAPEPLCDIAKLTGVVPLACLFKCQSGICEGVKDVGYFDENEDRIIYGRRRHGGDAEPREPRCNRCGSTDVRWRQQGGKWTLFSLEPGKLHVCPLSDDDFPVVQE